MNDILDDIGKKMPYQESREYLDNLIDASTEKAIMRHVTSSRNRHQRWKIASAAAVAALVIGFGIAFSNRESSQQVMMANQGPLDEFLSTLSDEEAAQLPFYEMEEIPEY